MIDRCTRWLEAIPVKDITAEVVAKVFYESWISRFGCPDRLTSDQGRQFESSLFAQLMKYMGITKLRTTPYHPQSMGIVERWHRSMKSALTARLINNSSWLDELPTVLLGLRAVGRSDNGVSPAEYVYGQTLRLPGDFYSSHKRDDDDQEFLRQLRDTINNLKPVSRDARDSRTLFIHSDLNKCDYVFIRNDAVRKPLTPTYDGPYKVLERKSKVFVIQLPNRKINVSIDRLKPAYVLNEDGNDKQSDIIVRNALSNSNPLLLSPSPTTQSSLAKTSRSGRIIRRPVRFDDCYALVG